METPVTAARKAFDQDLADATTADAAWSALQKLCEATVGCKLFTVMTVDNVAGLARRAFSNQPKAYPASGTKPIHRNRWFIIVHDEKRSFVANTLTEIATVFPDHELIGALGLGSVLNLPVVQQGEVVATINLLDVAEHYTPLRVATAESQITEPALKTYLTATRLYSS